MLTCSFLCYRYPERDKAGEPTVVSKPPLTLTSHHLRHIHIHIWQQTIHRLQRTPKPVSQHELPWVFIQQSSLTSQPDMQN